MVRHAPPSSDRTARSRPPPASSSPISRSRSEGPPFSDLATTAATRGHGGWRCGEEKVVDHRVDNDRHDDTEDDQPPAHPVGHLSPPTSCRRLRFHGQDYYRDSINRFLDDGRKDPRRLSCPELVRQRHKPQSRWPFQGDCVVFLRFHAISVIATPTAPSATRIVARITGSRPVGPYPATVTVIWTVAWLPEVSVARA